MGQKIIIKQQGRRNRLLNEQNIFPPGSHNFFSSGKSRALRVVRTDKSEDSQMLFIHCASLSLLINEDNTMCLLEVAHLHDPNYRQSTILICHCHSLPWDLWDSSKLGVSQQLSHPSNFTAGQRKTRKKISTGRNQSNVWEILITLWAAKETPRGA